MSRYGESFLTKHRWVRTDTASVDSSMFVWSDDGTGVYRLSWLGVLNGFLTKIGLVLTVSVDSHGNIFETHIVKKWW